MSRNSRSETLEQYPEWNVLQAMDIINKYERVGKYSNNLENSSNTSRIEASNPYIEAKNTPVNGVRGPMDYQHKLIMDNNPAQLKFLHPIVANPNFVYTIPFVQYSPTYMNPMQPHFLYPNDQSPMYTRYQSVISPSQQSGPVIPDPPRTPIPQRRPFMPSKDADQNIDGVPNDNRRFTDSEQRSRDAHYQPIRFYHKTTNLEADNFISSQANRHNWEETFETNTRNRRLGSGRLISALNKVNQAAVNLQKMSSDLNKNVNSILEAN